ncbi:hypothetical protein FOA52_007779 [Chlamydomonas sp. UWO 241]|nr:hypothetical protein FOA52_007779 [Chlamydomonas sp. UWO 241]
MGDQVPPWRASVPEIDEDSVDAQYAGEFSEETRNMMKGYGKPTWLDEESSLDPVEDLEEHEQYGLRLPPTTYDAAQAAADEYAAELRAAAGEALDPEEEALIRYRRDLVKGTDLEELKLLKLRAYHRAMDTQRARAAAASPEARRQLMEEYDVPLDAVPAELIDMSPEQLAERWAASQQGGSSAPAWDDPLLDSDGSEWAADWAATGYLTSAAGRAQLVATLGLGAARRGAPAPTPRPEPQPKFGDLLIHGDPSNYQVYEAAHGYTPEYLEQQQLQRKWRMQQRQRALAFWLPLSGVLGLAAVKGVRALLRARRAAGDSGKPKKKKLVAVA